MGTVGGSAAEAAAAAALDAIAANLSRAILLVSSAARIVLGGSATVILTDDDASCTWFTWTETSGGVEDMEVRCFDFLQAYRRKDHNNRQHSSGFRIEFFVNCKR